MRHNFVPRILLISAVVSGLVPLAGATLPRQPVEGKPASEQPAKLSSSQQAKLNQLLRRFRAAKDPQKCQRIVQEAVELGPPALAAIDEALAKQLAPDLKRYSAEFQQQAALIMRKRGTRAGKAEVAALRQTVLSLGKDPNLTKEMIVEKGDPAMQRLTELLLISAEEVLARSDKLRQQRQRLTQWGAVWDLCQMHLRSSQPAQPGQLPQDQGGEIADQGDFQSLLAGAESAALAQTIEADPRTAVVLQGNVRLMTQLRSQEAAAIAALNVTRVLLGLPALAIDPRLCAAARDHSADMERLQFFSHTSPVEGKASFSDRAKRFGASASGENIYVGQTNGLAAHQGWFHSPGHHRNQLGNHSRIGVGNAGRYFTQMFGR